MDEAEVRLEEIDAARRTLKRRGLPALRAIVERRAVSQSLRSYLEKMVG